MNTFLMILVRTGIALPIGGLTWIVSLLGYDVSFPLSVVYGLGASTASYFITDGIIKHQVQTRQGLSRKEYKFIQSELKTANEKISRLNKYVFSIRHFSSFKQRIDLMRVTKKIYRLTKEEPRRFYKAEKFYYSHLDSLVEISEKYAMLSAQPRKNKALQATLNETRRTLDQLSRTVEDDLHDILSDDIDDLHFELDVVKHISKKDDSETLDEGRRPK
ncbi:5-bromo-4-chloroindolyl phosphate hydrolysis family protein [Bacillus sp. B1-b2]|uniref:5-bromo-4-chloroindolyl phosphate hydrolysis family protein n=1 Tax=Bacillus sp. B1-b2 TaxID=2653201 RepID=UPI0012617ECB|nr:5-bromo-4-chloroindolyl phosphate hydrolysis family protein [Bacillus sp. B1-b2]KAB7664883.1 protein xpaC [Bacillus sp. B1-b2]